MNQTLKEVGLPSYEELIAEHRARQSKPVEKTIAKFTFSVGLLYRGAIRGALARFQFRGADIDFIETKCLLDSVFVVKGDPDDVQAVADKIKELAM